MSQPAKRVHTLAYEIRWLVWFVVATVAAPILAHEVYESTGGDWTAFTGGGGRSPAVPMWVLMGVTCLLAVQGVIGTVSYTVLIVRRTRRAPDIQSSEA